MKKIALTIISVVFPLVCGAQALKGSYFLDNSLNRHELNPAFAPRADYVQFFGIGNTGVTVSSNMDIPTFYYPNNGELVTFLHPSVSVSDFDKALAKSPGAYTDISTTLVGFGFYTRNKSFWTVDLDLVGSGAGAVPRDLFMFLKKGTGTSSQRFNVGNYNVEAYAGIQASVGYSRNIFKGLRVGAKARLILPVAYASMYGENMMLETAPDKWVLSGEGYFRTAINGVDPLSTAEDINWNAMLSGNMSVGLGYSFDLGAEYVLDLGTVVDGLSVSAAVTGLGQIHYKASAMSTYKSEEHVELSGIQDLEKILDNFSNPSKVNDEESFTLATTPWVRVGVEMPFLKNMMSVGLLYSARTNRVYTSNELMVSYNLNPCRWFALGLNYSFLSGTDAMGFLVEFTPRVGPAFYIGCDCFPTSYAKVSTWQGVNVLPMSMKCNLNFGLAVHIGGKTTKEK